MIQKRYKQTEKLAQAQAIKAMLETLPVILAEIDLPEIPSMPNHNQILRVRNINVAISVDYIKISPERLLIDKTSGEELGHLNLQVPLWEITASNMSSHVNEQGEREYYEMEWFESETDEVVTTQMVEVGLDEDGNPIFEEQPLETPADEVFLMPSIPYLMMFAKQIVLPDLIETFSHQFVDDNREVWTRLKEPK